MNILIPHSWLADYLKTDASPKKIAECLSLCGPSVEKLERIGNDFIYNIEVTTNRVDMMSVYGIAREAAVILPQFGYKTTLSKIVTKKISSRKKLDIKIVNNPKICKRILAIKLENVKLGKSPNWLSERLINVGQRSLNNAIDITNYVMWEIGHPLHVFDYDRIRNKKIIVREARKGEELTTLDSTTYTLSGGEVVFDNGKGEIIDLPGIMGTANTVVTSKTKNVLIWIESVDPIKIRKASMGLNIRSQASILNEKQVDPELGSSAILRAVELFRKVTGATVASNLVDIYPAPYKPATVKTTKIFIDRRLGLHISKLQIKNILNRLDFTASWNKYNLTIKVPSFRAHDITIAEDLVEEIARIYGYYKLPSRLMEGKIPDPILNSPFPFENKVKMLLKGWGAIEVYNISMVAKEEHNNALELKNPLGRNSAYMRTSLMKSLIASTTQNIGERDPFHLFEMANIYVPKKRSLPEEVMTLAGIYQNYKYRDAKGIVESLLENLHINSSFIPEEGTGFAPNKRVKILSDKIIIGEFGVLEEGNFIYYEFQTRILQQKSKQYASYKLLPKYPAQIEDLTYNLPEKTKVGDVIETIKVSDNKVGNIELIEIYKDSYTFRVWYQDKTKTLTDKEVEIIRKNILAKVKQKHGASLKN